MFIEIILNTVLVPLVLGIVLYGVARASGRFDPVIAIVAGAILLAIFVLLEGWPQLPPISSKPKVAVLMVGFTLASVLAAIWRVNRFALVSGLLVAGLAWIGWNRLQDPAMLPRFVALLVPIFIGGWMFHKPEIQDQAGLTWPVTLIAFGIGGAVVSLTGAYIGFAQMMGAVTALVGGFALVAYVMLLFRPAAQQTHLPRVALQVIFMGMMAVLIAIGLFAPEVSVIAIAILGLTMLAPLFQSRLDAFRPALRPILIGVVAAIPTLGAIVISAL
jgi:hypothetical protein